ncbi:hypothetical protein CA850_24205 [Micromonospora echinospora]|uniref:Leucine rich repeat (LRR) protein n=2 Tax=Micromonospora echinospora TaxID=1877 RepID=A0A1C4WZD0_MICEC|nr:hypothetical protein CA850_24205 [Micromonospora echinospora]SCF01546.1 hypothetical protein GA0070618_2629 [Micromonospora echinospora]
MPAMPKDVAVFSDSRYRHLYPPDGEGIYGVGNVDECDHLTVDGAGRIGWNRRPTPDDVTRMRSLHLCPSPAQLRRPALPPWLATLPALRSLALPVTLLPLLDRDRVPPGLATLIVGHDAGHPAPATPVDLADALPGLCALLVVSAAPRPGPADLIGPLPALEFLATPLHRQRRMLDRVAELDTLRHLELSHLGDLDVFPRLTVPLRALELAGTGRAFPIDGLRGMPTVAALRLNSIGAEIDCAIFRDLPELTDLTVLNSRRLRNVEALLDCPKLAHLTVVNCRDAFGAATRALFRERGFARLDVDYA